MHVPRQCGLPWRRRAAPPPTRAGRRSATHPIGGTAYLSLESEDEPYLAGVKFTAMPPTKRFRDMEQLSGGEKACTKINTASFAAHRAS
jgi:hypothetical protein